jgi:hypothetical protein
MMGKKALAILFVVAALLIAGSYYRAVVAREPKFGRSSQKCCFNGTFGEDNLISKLGLFVAEEIIRERLEAAAQGQLPPDNAIIVQMGPDASVFSFTLTDLSNMPYDVAWKFAEGELQLASHEEVKNAEKNRDAHLFLFSFRPMEKNKALVDALTIYPLITDTHGVVWNGAEGSVWELVYNKQESTWRILDKEITLIID